MYHIDAPVPVQDTQEEAGEEQNLDLMEAELDVKAESQPGTSDVQGNTSQQATAPVTRVRQLHPTQHLQRWQRARPYAHFQAGMGDQSGANSIEQTMLQI